MDEVREGPAVGFTHTMVDTPFCHCPVAFDAPCFRSRDDPTRARDTATVRMAATVISRLRQRLVAASRETYPAETGISYGPRSFRGTRWPGDRWRPAPPASRWASRL